MNTKAVLFAMAVACMIAGGCASSKVIEAVPSENTVSVDAGEHRLFLVGDGGEDNQILRDNLALLRQRLQASDIPATVIYLGDNIYPRGIPEREDSAEYEIAVNVLNVQMKGVEDLTEATIFIPGNHDWNKGKKGGHRAIRAQDKLIKNADVSNTRMLPKKGCPGPEVVELTDDVALIIIDSQWWLQDWSTEEEIHDDCDIRTRADFMTAFSEILKDYQEEQVIVAMHHPLVSAGPHGGYFTFKDHLFPFTASKSFRNFYLPLPVIGSIYPIYRSNFGNIQDIAHHRYQELRNGLLFAARLYDNVIFVSGHEHALEYHKSEKHHFLVSGAGSRDSELGKPRTLHYGHGAPGFMQLNLKDRGAVDLLVWEPDRDTANPVYRASVTSGVQRSQLSASYPDVDAMPDVTQMAISTRYAKGGLYRFFFGERYRDIYEIPVPAKVLDLDDVHGGLTPMKKGGGMQTNSLRLETKDGKEYAARSMNKDASKLLPENLQSTFATDIVQDQFTASHPYAAFVVPQMAEAAGVYHTNPELVYIPKQKALGIYADEFGDQLFLFEERPSGDWSGYNNFGGSKDIISYADVVEETMDDYRNRVDQVFTARSRMFDHFLGDWDRHDDQWRWAAFDRSDGKGKYYRPVPRDRDQAFADYDGLIVGMAKLFTPITRKLVTFREDVKSMKWFNDNGKYFDRDFMNELTEEQMVAVARELQSKLTDEVIEQSIRQWPTDVFAKGGEHVIATLKARRDNLHDMASRFHRELSKKVFIRGTNNADLFEITREPGKTTIRLFDSDKEGNKNEKYYERTFTNNITKEIQLYALEGQDIIQINGSASGGIRIYVVGGEGDDKALVEGNQRAGNIRMQDTQSEEDVVDDEPVTYHQVGDVENTYGRRSFMFDYAVPKIIIAGNPDDGLLLGGGAQWTVHGFQKSPYASLHTLTGFYAIATQAFGIDYAGEWTDVFGTVDAGLTAAYKGPTFVQNFFGFGNDSEEFDFDGENKDFYRVRKQNISVVPFLRLGQEQGSSLKLRFGYESHEVEDSDGRFVTSPQSGLNADVFENKQFGVLNLAYQYRIVDNPVITRRGIDLDISGGLDFPLEGDDDAHRYLKTSLALYYQFKSLGKPVLATRVGMDWHGGDYQFYQGAILGSHDNFRGVRKERFVGDRMFYHNTDLRIRISQWRSYYLPASFGIQLNFDHGRVWYEPEESDTWHYAYGGGLWISPFQTLLLSVNYHKSDVDNRISVAMGFFF